LLVGPIGELFGFVWCAIAGRFRSRAALQAEILVLRHQLNLLRGRSPKRVVLGKFHRLVFCGLYRSSPTELNAANAARPEVRATAETNSWDDKHSIDAILPSDRFVLGHF
jgi:hypothetical protein